ncbi:MAG: hypothetical protein IPL53_20525 [Ignavibacteria bacterium]|nr:hypothetical protein [Ignavibacteria bacterium]
MKTKKEIRILVFSVIIYLKILNITTQMECVECVEWVECVECVEWVECMMYKKNRETSLPYLSVFLKPDT